MVLQFVTCVDDWQPTGQLDSKRGRDGKATLYMSFAWLLLNMQKNYYLLSVP